MRIGFDSKSDLDDLDSIARRMLRSADVAVERWLMSVKLPDDNVWIGHLELRFIDYMTDREVIQLWCRGELVATMPRSDA